MSIKVKLENNRGNIETKKGLDINQGECVFPFKYQDVLYNECYKGKKGEWCATDTNPKTKTIKKWAYCMPKKMTIKKKKVSATKNSVVKKSVKKQTEPKKTKKRKLVIKKLFDISAINPDFIIPPEEVLQPKKYVLNNKKAFINWFDSSYGKYRVKKDNKFVKGVRFSYFNHQKIIRDYINNNSPYRGVLLYHGLGVGKTCASIAIAEGFKSNKKIIVMLNRSLRENFRDNLKFCGFEFFRTNQHWFFHRFSDDDPMKTYARELGITIKRDLKGAWFVDFTKKTNYDKLTTIQQKQVGDQIDTMIDSRYSFINLDGLNEKKLIQMQSQKIFDNCVLIIDEVHNLTNAMSKSKPGIRAKYLENLIMNAENLKLVFLSGTPMINNLFETAKLFNMLRGYINTFEITITDKSNNWELIEKTLNASNIIDQIFIDKRNRVISLTRVPLHYIKTANGIVKSDMNIYTDKEFIGYLESILPECTISIKKFTAFPNKEEDFMKLFFDPIRNEFKNEELFKSRIIGLISYYRTQDKGLIPTVTKNEIIKVPMSEYQFIKYAQIRKQEIENDKLRNQKKKKKKKNEDIYEIQSSYRAYSRMHCSFVFPESIPRPYPTDEKGDMIEEIESELDEIDEKKEKKEKMKRYENEKTKTLKMLDRQKKTFLIEGKPDQLQKYSPKYNIILNSIRSVKGLSFVYTEYKTLEGIAVLSIVLKANGYAPFVLNKNKNGDYLQVFEHPDDENKPKYAFWGGGKPEESELIRKIYNNEFEELPRVLREQMMTLKKTNLRGETIKVLLTTKTGAEGIDLKNVRQVHIVEPYWNPVRIKQVKGRAVRVGSHIQLPEKDRTVELFLYISEITPAMKKTDPVIEMDKNGATSDQVLFELSQKKLKVMETLLRVIKESSIDCSLNYNDTYSSDDPFTCLSYGTTLNTSPSFIPDITKQTEDKDLKRTVKKTTWTPKIISLKIKGTKKSFALKPAPLDKPQLLYNIELLRDTGRPGVPIGELKIKSGKQILVLYPQTSNILI